MRALRRFGAASVGTALLVAAAEGWAKVAAEDTAASREIPVSLSDARVFLGIPPAGWEKPAFDDRAWAGPFAGPFAPRAATGAAPVTAGGVTLLDHVPGGALLIRRTFDLGESGTGGPASVRILELRVRYADGFIAYLNGREVARRGLPSGPPNNVRPVFPHTLEVERVRLAVPAATGSLKERGNLLAVAIFPAEVGTPLAPVAPAGDVTVAAFAGVRIVRGPYLMAPAEERPAGSHTAGRDSVLMAWETDLPATGVVTVEPADAAAKRRRDHPRAVRSAAPALRHVVKLTGLLPGASYRYRLSVSAGRAGGDQRGPFVLRTFPPPSEPARFAVYGDLRSGHAAHAEVVAGLVREAPVVVLNTGDLVVHGSEESAWQTYFDIAAPLGAIAPIVPALGNHDASRGGTGAAKTWNLFGLKTASPAKSPPGWMSFDLADVHFIILDSNQMNNRAQHSWLEADLAQVRRRPRRPRAVFAFCHEGPWSNGPHGGSSLMVQEFAPRLAAGGVDVLFSGHDHLFERGLGVTPSGPLPYVVAGGGGAPLYNPTCQPMSMPAFAPAVGVPGPLPACPPSVITLIKAYHYVMVEVGANGITLCPKRPDGTALEACTVYPPRR